MKPAPITVKKPRNLLITYIFIASFMSMGVSASQPQIGPGPLEAELQKFIAEQTSRMTGRIEVEFGQIDPRLTLAPCAKIEPYLPASARLWGKTNIGLKCVSGAFWNVSLPIHVRVFGTALVTNRNVQAGQALLREDFVEQELELTRDHGRPVYDLAALENKTLSRSIGSGVILREEWMRSIPVIQSGDQVKVIAIGAGFSVTSEGQAISSAVEGQVVRVRAESGRVVTGVARPGRIAEIRL